MSDFLCQTFLVVFVQCIFGNPHSELILEADLTSDPSFYVVGRAQFFVFCFKSNFLKPHECVDKTERAIEHHLCTFHKCVIEVMTCAVGKASFQEKAAQPPSNNRDARFVQANEEFL